MFLCFSVFFAVLMTCTSQDELHGINPQIIGGNEAKAKEFPWQVSLQNQEGSHECGATIISDQYIITAAHCTKPQLKYYRVCTGINRRNPYSIHRVTGQYVYAGYGTTIHGKTIDDIAIMKVNPRFKFTKSNGVVAHAKLPEQYVPTLQGTIVTVTGWGVNATYGVQPEILHKVEMPVVAHDQCNIIYENIGGIGDGTICAGTDKGGKDSCQGDSGGPLVVGNELRGISAWGPFPCGQPGFPSVYTEVAYFRNWIRSIKIFKNLHIL